jgi:rubrerythrin
LDVDRRRFLGLAGLGGAASLLSACGNEENEGQGPIAGEREQDSAQETPESDVADVNVLNSALDLEHQAVAAYGLALKVLEGENREYARAALAQEREHVKALTRAIKDLKGTPNAERRDYGFPSLRTEGEVLRFAQQLENTAIAAYIDALPKLNDPELRAAGASIVANEAQHLALINGALGERSAPEPFVTGTVEG